MRLSRGSVSTWVTRVLAVAAFTACSSAEKPPSAELPEGGYVALAEYDTNPVVASDEQNTVNLGVSADRASWAFVHHYLARGSRPPPALVRVEECITAMAPAPPSPAADAPMGLSASLAPSPFRPGWQTLVIGIAAPLVARKSPYSPEHIGVLSEQPDGALEKALVARGANFIPRDWTPLDWSFVSYPIMIWISDGAGLGGPRAYAERLARAAEMSERIDHLPALAVVARIRPGLNDALLDQVAWAAHGTYDVLVPGEEAQLAALLLRPPALVDTLARVTFDPAHVLRWRLVGYDGRVGGPALRQGGGTIRAGDGTWLLFEVQLAPSASGALANVLVRERSDRLELPVAITPVSEAPAAHRAVVAIAAFAEKLRDSTWGRQVSWDAIAAEVANLGTPALRSELGDLVRKARGVVRESGSEVDRDDTRRAQR